MIQKILLVGSEMRDTDDRASALAQENNTSNHGLIEDPGFTPEEPGYYHTSVVDLNEGQVLKIAKYFDSIVMLDQPQSEHSHWKVLLRIYKMFKILDERGFSVDYLNNENVKRPEYWYNLLRENPSFCFYPFLVLVPETNYTHICPKSKAPITIPKDIVDWATDPKYNALREPMVKGERLDRKYCGDCYDREAIGIESNRQFETLEWANKMEYDSIENFRVPDPVFYEIRPSNKCNLMCRMCDDVRSHLIEQERIEVGLPLTDWRFQDLSFDSIALETVQRVYIAGGEPTVMPEFYTFLQNCIDAERTDFEICIGTNGMHVPKKMLDLLRPFADILLSISFDGYGKLNDYIRWNSNFDKIVENSRILREEGHKISLQTVPSMYNVTRLHEIFEWYDEEYPDQSCLVQAAAGHGDVLEPFNHPRADLVVASMERCMKTNIYTSAGRSIKTYVDSMYEMYSDPDYKYNPELLKGFFIFNDIMDRSRGSVLGDICPELEECRSLLTF